MKTKTVGAPGQTRLTVLFLPEDWSEHNASEFGLAKAIVNHAKSLSNTGLDSDLHVLSKCLGLHLDCRTVVIEHDYYDLDYRSENSTNHSLLFKNPGPSTDRVHLFSTAFDFSKPIAAEIKACKDSYLGYIILRPIREGIVGRTLIRPPSSAVLRDVEVENFDRRVRTAVTEAVNLHGQTLTARGAPFMQQDGHLMRCAHVVAWMAHYTAVLRGHVVRRPTAQFPHSANSEVLKNARAYPSTGLIQQELYSLLNAVDLPPEAADVRNLMSDDYGATAARSGWYGRPSMFPDAFWDALTSTMARYLNGGFPVAVTDGPHIRLVVGYLRGRRVDQSQGEDDGLITHLIVNDDQRGPYRIVSVADLVDSMRRRANGPENQRSEKLIIPLPRDIWLTGQDAEERAALEILHDHNETKLALESVEDTLARFQGLTPQSAEVIRGSLDRLSELIEGRDIALRSYPCTGVDFKHELNSRFISGEGYNDEMDAPLLDFITGAKLPKFVWVVEITVRSERRSGKSGVIGEVVLDASGSERRTAKSLLVHLPGLAFLSGTGEDKREWRTGSGVVFYNSGRWQFKHSGWVWGQALRAKGSYPSNV